MTESPPIRARQPSVGLFVTCLVDLFRPEIGFAAIKLLEAAGCTVVVPRQQTCCGQPAYNSGALAEARALAGNVIRAFQPFDAVVVPSGSCAGMLRHHLPALLEGEPRAAKFAAKVFELTQYLVDQRGWSPSDVRFEGTVTYHDGCAGYREMGVKDQPRALLAAIAGLSLAEHGEAEACCGFGGLFCVKYPEVAEKITRTKLASLAETGADTVLAGELGCLMNLAGKAARDGSAQQFRHVAELLADMADTRPIAGD